MIELHHGSWRVRTKYRSWPSVTITVGPTDADEALARSFDRLLRDLHAAGRRDVFEALRDGKVQAYQVETGVQLYTVERYRLPAPDVHEQAPEAITLGELVDRWESWMRKPTTVSRRGGRPFAPSTIRRWRQSWEAVFKGLPDKSETRAESLTTERLRDVLDERMRNGLSPSGANRDATAVSACFTWAIEDEGMPLTRPRWRKLPEPDPDAEESHIEHDQLQLVIAAHPTDWSGDWADLWRLLALTGLRIGEAQHLQARDISLREGWIEVVVRDTYRLKGRRAGRRVPIPESTIPILKRWLRDRRPAQYLLPDELRSYDRAEYRWTAACKAANLLDADALERDEREAAYTIHSLRHLYGVTLARAGLSLLEIGSLMGHTNEATTRRYARYRPKGADLRRFARLVDKAARPARVARPKAAEAPVRPQFARRGKHSVTQKQP